MPVEWEAEWTTGPSDIAELIKIPNVPAGK
jgi:hypothetical protein